MADQMKLLEHTSIVALQNRYAAAEFELMCVHIFGDTVLPLAQLAVIH